jgi:AcrR family transcriptional regulator
VHPGSVVQSRDGGHRESEHGYDDSRTQREHPPGRAAPFPEVVRHPVHHGHSVYHGLVPMDHTPSPGRPAPARAAAVAAAGRLVSRHGLERLSMAGVAAEAGIGRATLYTHFSHVGELVRAWREATVSAHLLALRQAAQARSDERVERVLQALAAGLAHQQGEEPLPGVSTESPRSHVGRTPDDRPRPRSHHERDAHPEGMEAGVLQLLTDVLADAAAVGQVRDDLAPRLLAVYCRHALAAARHVQDRDQVDQLVVLVAQSLRPRRS